MKVEIIEPKETVREEPRAYYSEDRTCIYFPDRVSGLTAWLGMTTGIHATKREMGFPGPAVPPGTKIVITI